MEPNNRRELTIFEILFEVRDDGTLTPRVPIRIAGVNHLPGASLGPNFRPFDVPIEGWKGHIIYGHHEGDMLVIDAVSRH